MELRTLRYFLMVAEELHFGNAAKRLHIVQPALSVQIRSLENELGGALFVRDRRHVELTAAGRLLRREAERILHEISAAETAVRETLAGRTGLLDIGFADNLEADVLATSVKQTRERYPSLQIRLWENDQPDLLAGVVSGRLHAAFIRLLSLRDIPQSLNAIPVVEWPIRLALPVGHRLANLASVPVEAFRDEPFIAHALYSNGPALQELDRVLGQEPNIVQKTNKSAVMYSLVASGLGIALLPELPAYMLKSEKVVLKPIKGKKLILVCCLIYRKDASEPAVKNFVKCVGEVSGQGKKGDAPR